VVIAIIAVLLGLVLPAVQKVREAASRIKCQNNLRQIGLALHQYHDAQAAFPPGCSYRNGTDPQPHMSWLTRLLPYVEQEALWHQSLRAFQQERFFQKGPHLAITGVVIPYYACPTDARTSQSSSVNGLGGSFQVAFTSYLGVGGTDRTHNDGILYLDSRIRLTDITDGTSNTLAVGERPPSANLNFGWWYAGWGQAKDGSVDMVLGVRERNVSSAGCSLGPYEFRPGRVSNQCDAFHFWSLHSGGAHFLFADGSVHFLNYSARPLMTALATRAGGDTIVDP
jgi:prepilin-type processing-associated H-X9-DG protein